jgi:hypothetical protein
VTVDGVWIGELDLLTTCIHHSELHFTVYLNELCDSEVKCCVPDCFFYIFLLYLVG